MLQRLFITAVVLLLAAPAARAETGVPIWGLSPEGNPFLSVPVAAANEVVYLQWWTCPPAQACAKYTPPGTDPNAWDFHGSPTFAPGDSARGTFFEVDGLPLKHATGDRSPMWMGRLTARNHPRILGKPRVGQKLQPVGALWAGGWANDLSTFALVACPASRRAWCEYLTRADGSIAGPGPRTLTAKQRGWYVYALDYRTPASGPPQDLRVGPIPRPVASAAVAVSRRLGPVRSAP